VNLSLNGIKFRLVDVSDAEFIYNLRMSTKLNRYISKISGTVAHQKEWIKEYKKREKENKEYYFIITDNKEESIGVVRVYNINDDSVEWGSWILDPEKSNPTFAIKSLLLLYEFVFETLEFTTAKLDVRKENKEVVFFHKSYGSKIVDENELDYFFNFEKSDYEKMKEKYRRYL